MIDFDTELRKVWILDDGFYGRRSNKPLTYGTNGKNITLVDICEQFNYTTDEDDENEQIGYTPRVKLGPKVRPIIYSII